MHPTCTRRVTCCSTLYRTATRCSTLQHTAVQQHTAAHYNTLQPPATHGDMLNIIATYCNTHLQAQAALGLRPRTRPPLKQTSTPARDREGERVICLADTARDIDDRWRQNVDVWEYCDGYCVDCAYHLRCSASQCVAVRCSVLQRVAA